MLQGHWPVQYDAMNRLPLDAMRQNGGLSSFAAGFRVFASSPIILDQSVADVGSTSCPEHPDERRYDDARFFLRVPREARRFAQHRSRRAARLCR
jgi:hypothetical protein